MQQHIIINKYLCKFISVEMESIDIVDDFNIHEVCCVCMPQHVSTPICSNLSITM